MARPPNGKMADSRVLGNDATHKTPAVRRWLTAHPRFHLHFTPASASWLNLVERWFAELTNRKLRRSSHRSLTDLEADVRAWIDAWNADPKPFVWVPRAWARAAVAPPDAAAAAPMVMAAMSRPVPAAPANASFQA